MDATIANTVEELLAQVPMLAQFDDDPHLTEEQVDSMVEDITTFFDCNDEQGFPLLENSGDEVRHQCFSVNMDGSYSLDQDAQGVAVIMGNMVRDLEYMAHGDDRHEGWYMR